MIARARALTALCALAVAGCATNPATGKRQLSLVGEGQEITMGRQAAEEVRSSIGLYPDEPLQAYVNGLGQRLAAGTERSQLAWSFHVADDPSVNAFALPGGFIYVTRGLLAYINSEAELAGVLGHEIGHVTARHSVNQISKSQLASVGLGVGMILRPELRPYGQIGEAGLGLLLLKHGRDDENEADELGLRYMTKVGYPAQAMPEVLRMLQRVSEGENTGRLPNWLSTHPNPQDRVTRVSGKIEEDGAASSAEERREPYLRQIDGIVFGPDPREGFFKGRTFYHPAMAFQVEFPEGFAISNQKQAVGAMSPNSDGLVVVTLAGRPSADAAAQEFFSQPGIQMGRRWNADISDLPSQAHEFAATAGNAPVRGIAAFVEHGGRVFQILGYSATTAWSRYDDAFAQSIESFGRLRERRYLDVQPSRIKVVPRSRLAGLDELVRQAPVGKQTLLLINGGDETAVSRKSLVKTVVGNPTMTEILREMERQRAPKQN